MIFPLITNILSTACVLSYRSKHVIIWLVSRKIVIFQESSLKTSTTYSVLLEKPHRFRISRIS